jgi:hypothetical protein
MFLPYIKLCKEVRKNTILKGPELITRGKAPGIGTPPVSSPVRTEERVHHLTSIIKTKRYSRFE